MVQETVTLTAVEVLGVFVGAEGKSGSTAGGATDVLEVEGDVAVQSLVAGGGGGAGATTIGSDGG